MSYDTLAATGRRHSHRAVSRGQMLALIAFAAGVLASPRTPAQAPAATAEISEFMAANSSTLLDEDGEAADWIEIHNPGSTPLNLAGWSLTDAVELPAKWVFPERALAPGAYLVVFASGKNRSTGERLHTNFKLDAAGDYLALIRPDHVTVASAFAPSFPRQYPDVSYGVPSGLGAASELLNAGTPGLVYLIPTNAAALPADWATSATTPAGTWRALPDVALGYDAAPVSTGGEDNLARRGTAAQSSTGFGFGAELAIDGDDNTFTHTTSEDNASTWIVDLGAEYEIRRIVLKNRTNCCGSRLRDLTVRLLSADAAAVLWSSALLNPENELDSPASIVVDLLELNVGPVLARMVQVERTPDPDLSGSGGTGNGDEDNVLSLGEVEVYGVEAISFGTHITTDLTATLRNQASAVFVRAPFVLDSPDALAGLDLQLRYDDGLVTYLNGQPIASFNAPASAVWNSTAVTDRAKEVALAPQSLDLLPFRAQLHAGTNWLAFQALNLAANDPDFLLEARLFARTNGASGALYLDRPTPGAANDVGGNLGRVADTKFSVTRGFAEAPFELVVTTETPGAEIRYTTDGSTPDATHGTVYTGPLRIERTTVVRVAAFKPGYRPTDVDSHTYLFAADILAQAARPAGFPTTWAGVAADYAMDPRITQDPAYAARLPDALRSLPSLSISTANDNLFGSSRGIYASPENGGPTWERPVSMEWIDPTAGEAFQIDCGLRIQGGYFRQRNVTQKHSLRLLFKNEYGPGRLRADLFHTFGAAREFDTLVLRAGANDGYAWSDAKDTEQFIRDEFGRRSLLAMGQASPHGRFVHVYLNGLYWGLYNLVERPAEDFSATYFGGAPENWDAINAGDVKNGSLDSWFQFTGASASVTTLAAYQKLKGLNPDGTSNTNFPAYLDAPNYIDYMLLNIWGGNWDWPNKNFWFGRERSGLAGGFKFYLWDFENTMGNNRGRSPLNMVAPRADIRGSWVGEPHERLRRFSEYQIEFADRIQRHFFGHGALTPGTMIARYREIADHVEAGIIAETARWGDDNLSPPQDLTDWLRERDWILGTYLPQRTAVVFAQLKIAGLYPNTPAPTFSPEPGIVPAGTPLVVSANASEIFYTTNGLDPRLPGGGIHPTAIRLATVPSTGTGTGTPPPTASPNLVLTGQSWRYFDTGTDPGATWTAADFDDANWKSGPSPLGYGDGDEATVVGFVDANAAQAGVQKNATTFFRTTFDVAAPTAYSALHLALTYDDAAAVYLNGREVMRTDNLPAGAAFNTYASGGSSDNAVLTRDDLAVSALRTGRNVLAVEVHQSDGSSSDISFDLELTGTLAGTGGGGTNQTSVSLVLAGDTTIRARAREGTVWSALSEGPFAFAAVPPSSNTLVISEFCYRPADPVRPEELAVTNNRDSYEFIELLNTGSQSLDLTGVRFTAGVLYNFAAGTTLAAGERLLVVSRQDAFVARYATAPRIVGEYQGNLDNGGEELALVDALGHDLVRFTYLDRLPWPAVANRGGYSLVLRQPASHPFAGDPRQWRASRQPGGSPGGTDATRFAGSPTADLDGNGQADLLDYALGSAVATVATPARVLVGFEDFATAEGPRAFLVVTVPTNPTADDTSLTLEFAEHLEGPWRTETEALVPVREERTPEGLARTTYRAVQPADAVGAAFLRLSVRWMP